MSGMADFKSIRSGNGQISIQEWLEMHEQDRDAIFTLLDTPYEGETIVMTHHMPISDLVAPDRHALTGGARLTNAAFASDLWGDIRKRRVSTWLCGHSHDGADITMEGQAGPVRFLTNPRGYPWENAPFDPCLVFETSTGPSDPSP